MTPSEYFQAGQLDESIEAAIQIVKSTPTDFSARFFLSELLCFAGDLERADRQLETLSQQSTTAAVRISLFRQLIRAEMARQQFFREGRLPEFVVEPTECLQLHLSASIALREGQGQEAVELLARAEQLRPHVGGSCDGTKFDDFRDLDDLNAPFLEVLTSTGKYYWVPVENIQTVEFSPPERTTDLLWRTAQLSVVGGPDGSVHLPALYASSSAADDNQLRLGRGTDWQGGDGTPVLGVGQKTFLVGESDKPIMQMHKLEFDLPDETTPGS